ncbi:MAG: 16S rRNA (guanine(527)-N(7))-methyltransferase RsmG [Pyrinomonadaceae bacterium]
MNATRRDFIDSINKHQNSFGLAVDGAAIEKLADFYEIVQEHNELLHLVGPCSPDEFATRHVLESLTLLEYLPANTTFADIGPGAGLPSIPCLLVRGDLRAILIESKIKKSAFLENTVKMLKIEGRAQIVDRQFEEADPVGATTVTCRALDKFSEKLPRLIKWAKGRPLLLFGGPNLKPVIENYRNGTRERLMPMSERRYLYIA